MKTVSQVIDSMNTLRCGLLMTDRTCEKHGSFTSFKAGGSWSDCPACVAAEEVQARWESERKRAEEREELAKRLERAERMKRCGIPERFREKRFSSFVADNKGQNKALAFALDFEKNFQTSPGRCAVFVGKPGTGKTHLAVSIGLELMDRGLSVLFITAIRAIRRIRDTWSKNASETESEAVSSLVWPDLLILDEVGVQFGSDAEKILLFDVLNERYEKRKSTIVISNLSLGEVRMYLGERIVDRFREDGGKSIVFDWQSHRKSNEGE